MTRSLPTSTTLLSVAIAACAVANLGAILGGDATLEYVFKSLTTVLTLALAATIPGTGGPYRRLVVAGLACSLAGDVFLMLPGDYFVSGLAAFLLAHLCYTAAFTRSGWKATPLLATGCGLYLMVLLWWLLPYAGPVRVPVAVYGLVICTMAWQALERWRAGHTPAAAAAALGALLFVASDTALAVDRFAAPFAWSPLAVMGTYVPAQWLIASSCRQ